MVCHVKVVGIHDVGHAFKEQMLKAANKSIAVPEGKRVSADGPDDGHQAHHGKALHHGAQDVLSAHQAAVEERQSRSCHQQDERRTGQHPCVVARRLRVLNRLLKGCNLRLGCGPRSWSCLGNDRKRNNMSICKYVEQQMQVHNRDIDVRSEMMASARKRAAATPAQGLRKYVFRVTRVRLDCWQGVKWTRAALMSEPTQAELEWGSSICGECALKHFQGQQARNASFNGNLHCFLITLLAKERGTIVISGHGKSSPPAL